MKNRWTPEDQQHALSPEAKMEYILRFGTIYEMREAVKHDVELAEKVYTHRTHADICMSAKSKNLVRHMIDLFSISH